MSQINRVPAGLLGLFDTKSLGKTPAQGTDVLSVGMDATPFYLSTVGIRAASVTESAAAGAHGAIAELEIPAGETWQIIGISSSTLFGNAAENMWFDIRMADVQASQTAGDQTTPINMRIKSDYYGFAWVASSASGSKSLTYEPPYPLIVQAPVKFDTFITRNGIIAARDVTTRVLYYQLD